MKIEEPGVDILRQYGPDARWGNYANHKRHFRLDGIECYFQAYDIVSANTTSEEDMRQDSFEWSKTADVSDDFIHACKMYMKAPIDGVTLAQFLNETMNED